MPRLRVVTLCLLLTLGLFLSCTDGEGPVSFEAAGVTAVLQIQTVFPQQLLSSAAEALPINRIRVTVTLDPGGSVVNTQVFDVKPNDDAWEIPVEIPLSDDPDVRYVITIELINFENGVEQTQWSARTPPLTVSVGSTPEVRQVEVVRGPVDNIGVVSLTLTGPRTVLQGEDFTLTASVQVSGGAATPTVFWTSLDPGIASIEADGSGQALAPGVARIQAVAGPITTVHEIDVIGVSADITIRPDVVTVTALGEVADFEATVVDSRGADRGESVTWSVSDARVARHLGDGRFEAIGGGETDVIATGVESPGLSSSARMIVDLAPVSLELRPSSLRLTALGEAVQLEAVGVDAQGNDVFGIDVEYVSRDPAIATVDRDGTVTAIAVGETVITATSEADGSGAAGSSGAADGSGSPDGSGASGESSSSFTIQASAEVTVVQEVSELVISPDVATLSAVGESVQFSASAFDGAGTRISDAKLTWRSGDTKIAEVDDTGLATAVGRGSTQIFVTSGDAEASAAFIVDIAVAEILVKPTVAFSSPGGTFQFEAELRGDNREVVDGLTVEWTSNDPTVATVDDSGLATGVSEGETRIVASFAGLSGSARMVVLDLGPSRLEFRTVPELAPVGEVMDPVEVVALTDDGRLANTYTGLVTLDIVEVVKGPARQVEEDPLFEGALAVRAEGGVATFDDLVINQLGTFTFSATTEDGLRPPGDVGVNVVVPTADLLLEKSVTPETVVGENGLVVFVVTITNEGPFPSKDIVVAETINSARLSVTDVLPGSGVWDGELNHWSIPFLGVGDVTTLTITGTALGEPGTVVTNSVRINSSSVTDPNGGNNSADANVTISETDIEVTKEVDNQHPLTGDVVTFTVTATNNGPVRATGVVVEDVEQASFSITDGTPTKGVVDEVEETWTIDALEPGESATLQITATILAAGGNLVTNTADLLSVDQTDSNPGNDGATISFHVNTPPVVADLTIGVPPDTPTVIVVPISDADGDDILAGAVAAGPSHGGVGAVTINSNTEAEFTYTPTTGFLGADQVTLTVTDQHGAVSAVGTVDITVTVGPQPSSYDSGGNTELITGAYSRPDGAHVFDSDGVLAATPGLTVTSTDPFLSDLGGTVDMLADGSFSYRPLRQFKGTDTFEFTVDSGQMATVTIEVTEMIWYVNNLEGPGPAGTGTSWDPFTELEMADGNDPESPPPVSGVSGEAGVNGGGRARLASGGLSEVGDVIFVFSGDGTSTGYDVGIRLLTGQSLFGEGIGLIADGMDGAPDWGVVVPAGAPPVLSGFIAIWMSSGSDVAGVVIDGADSGIFSSGAGGFQVFDVAINNTVSEAVLLGSPTGDIEFQDVHIDGGEKGIRVAGGDAMINFSGSIMNTTLLMAEMVVTTGGEVGLFGGPFTWHTGGGVFLDRMAGNFQADNARALTGSDRAIEVIDSDGDVFMNGFEIDATTLNAIDFANYGGNGMITLSGGNFPNNAGRALKVLGLDAGASLVIDGTTLIEENGDGFRLTEIDGFLDVRAPTIIRQTGFGVGVEVNSGTGTIDFADLTVDMRDGGGAPPAAPGGYDPRYADWEGWVGVLTAGINISGTNGTVTFNNLDVSTDNEWGMLISGAGSGSVRVFGPSSEVNAEGAPAIEATNVDLDMTFSDVSSTGSPGDGIRLQSTTGMFNATGGFITNTSGVGVALFTGSTTFNYDGAITTPVGSGRSVIVSGNGGTSTFNGLVQERGLGVLLSGNDSGSKTAFQGGLDIDVTTGLGFLASGDGPIEVTGPGNSIDAVGVPAVDIHDSAIGPAGITFESISSSSPTGSGITLNNTGTGGGFTVTGTGALGSGGLIDGASGDGINILGGGSFSFTEVDVTNSGGNGILIDGSQGFTLHRGTISDNGDAVTEDGIELDGVIGTASITESTITGNHHDNLRVGLNAGTLDLTIDGTTFADAQLGTGTGIRLNTFGTGMINATVAGSSVIEMNNEGVRSRAVGDSKIDLDINNSTLQDNTVGVAGVTLDNSTLDQRIDSNIFNNNADFAVDLDAQDGVILGSVSNNPVSTPASGKGFNFSAKDGDMRLDVATNSLTGLDGAGIVGKAGYGATASGSLSLKLTDNTLSLNGGASGPGFDLLAQKTANMCLDMRGNSVPVEISGADELIVTQLDGSIFNVERFTGLTPDEVFAHLNGENSTIDVGLRSGVFGGVDGGVCSLKRVDRTNHAPRARITGPADGTSFTDGDPITFDGLATDAEDGALAGASLQWTSSISGAIGSGVSFSRSDLPVGTHTITLTATDSDSVTGIASITIEVDSGSEPEG